MSTLASFQNQVKPNWCPGCGDYAVQMALQQAAVKTKSWNRIKSWHWFPALAAAAASAVIYTPTGMHTTHGRALPFAQGVKLATLN